MRGVKYFMCAAGLMVLATASAQASVVNMTIDGSFGSAESTGATADITLTFSEDGADDLMTVLMENTTPNAIGSSLTAVGFELPDSLSLSPSFATGGTSAYFDTLTYSDGVSPSWLDAPGGYDLMITSDGNFEGGNPNGAPIEGASQTVILSLGDTGLAPADLATTFEDYYKGLASNYVIARFQSVGPGGDGSDKVLGHVPEPGSLALLALSGLGLLRRRRITANR